jgi:DNA-binding beta-propeller fold protein YncE
MKNITTFTGVAIALIAGTLSFAHDTTSIFPLMPGSVSTVPSNGDVNPYGVAFAPANLPAGPGLQAGDILVTNFNNSENLQGTGTTIIRITKGGQKSTFFTAPQQFGGLSAAICILSDGLVFVGDLPTADGTSATAQVGRIAVLDRAGDFLGTFGTPSLIQGPWGMAVHDVGNGVTGTAKVWISNVLNGTVVRFNLSYNAGSITASQQVLATGFSHRADPAALELGPSGLAYNAAQDKLYVASSSDNAIYEIATAAAANSEVTPSLFLSDPTHLHGPLDLAFLPNGNLLVANSDGSNVDPNQPSEIVEYTAAGVFISQMPVDPNNGGAFGLAVNNIGWGTFTLAAVDDNANTLNIWTAVAK